MSRTLCSRRRFAILARTFVGNALGFIRAYPPARITAVASVCSVTRTVRARARDTVETGTLVHYVTTTMKSSACGREWDAEHTGSVKKKVWTNDTSVASKRNNLTNRVTHLTTHTHVRVLGQSIG